MLFNSFEFILLFLPVTAAGWFLLNKTGKRNLSKLFLLLASLVFYAWLDPAMLIVLFASILINCGFYRLLTDGRRKKGRKAFLVFGLILNIGALFAFKYLAALMSGLNLVFHAELPVPELIFPLGISFITFRQVGLLVDAYEGKAYPGMTLLDLALSSSFFCTVISGPLMSHGELIGQFNDGSRRTFSADNLMKGSVAFILGLAKKILIADVFGRVADYAWTAAGQIAGIDVIIAVFAYYIQLYFDFSGYSDMARGIGKILGINVPVNFDSPLKAVTIRDFWKRWHITLTGFLTRYVYFPLGGSRRGNIRTYVNIMIVFLVSGIWHGAGVLYILWGLFHGLGMVFCRLFDRPLAKAAENRILSFFLWLLTQCYAALLFIAFKAESLKDAFSFLGRLFAKGKEGFDIRSSVISEMFRTKEFSFALKVLHVPAETGNILLCLGYFVFALVIVLAVPNVNRISDEFKPGAVKAAGLALLFLWAFVSISGVSTYVYFRF